MSPWSLSVSVLDLTAIRHFTSSTKMKIVADLIHSGRSLTHDKDDKKKGS